MRLDPTDWMILRDLYRWDASNLPLGPLRISLRELAKTTGLHRNTVQARVAALRRSGVLEGMVFEPRPQPLGLVRSGYIFRGTRFADAGELARAIEPFPSISAAVLCVDYVFLHLWHEAARLAPRDIDAIRRVFGAREAREGYVSTDFPQEPGGPARLAPADVPLVLALRRNPERPMAALAHDLGLETRTAERRAARLIERGVGAMVPLFRPSRVEGWILVHYVAETDGAGPGLAAAFPDRVIGPFGPKQISTVMVPLPNLAQVEVRRRKAEKIPGVGALRAVLVADAIYPAPFEAWLAERVESVHRGRALLEVAAGT